MMNAMMQETLLTGTARKAELPGWQAAGKTGTSQDWRDAWFVGYTSRLVTGVWLGNDDGSPTKKASGGNLPVEIWSRFMRAAHRGRAAAAAAGGALAGRAGRVVPGWPAWPPDDRARLDRLRARGDRPRWPGAAGLDRGWQRPRNRGRAAREKFLPGAFWLARERARQKSSPRDFTSAGVRVQTERLASRAIKARFRSIPKR